MYLKTINKAHAMNTKILLFALSVALVSSCTSAYKAGQTPDDVYYSPAKEKEAYVNVEERQEGNQQQYNSNNYSGYNSYDYRDDRFLRLSIANRYRWNDFDYYYMTGSPYNRFDYNLYSPWNSYYYWNNFY